MDNLYYRPSVRTSRRSFKKTKYLKFVYPVLAILFVIMLIFGLSKIWSYFTSINSTSFSNSATIYVAEGMSAQKQSYGTTQFLPLFSGDILLEGDSVRTLQDTRVVLEFFNGLLVRLDEGTSLTVEKIENKKNEEVIHLKVLAGNVWLNKPETIKSTSNLVVSTNYLKANTIGTIFAINAGLPEMVAVIDGTVLVDIVDPVANPETALDQVNVMANQQIILDNVALESFKRRETPRVLSGISDDFKDADWYEWNIAEDENPTQFEADAALGSNSDYISQIDETESMTIETDEDLDETESLAPKPEFSFPKNDEVINTERVEIIGTVPVGTQAVVVTSFETGTPEPYVLKGFKAGDLTFKYIAVYTPDNAGNLRLGVNRFEAVAVDEDGVESPASELEFIFKPDGVELPTTTDTPSTPVEVDVSNLEFSENLAAPVLKSVNDAPAENGYTLTTDRGVVTGSIGTWAKSVVVNGYKLQQYEPYSGEFSYILSTGFGTLKKGENKIVVYGFDDAGNRGMPATFIINW